MIVHVTLELCILQNPQELMLWNIILTTVNFLQLREDTCNSGRVISFRNLDYNFNENLLGE